MAAAASDLHGLGLLDSPRAGRGWPRAASRPRTRSPEHRPAAWTSRPSLLCDEAAALLLDCRSGDDGAGAVRPRRRPGHALLVIDTRAEHALVDGQYARRRDACEDAARRSGVETLREMDPADLAAALDRLLRRVSRARVRHVVTEIERVRTCVEALRRGDFDEVGRLFEASHASLRDDYEVSLRRARSRRRHRSQHGALGARMTGGGFGGSCIALVPADRVDAVASAVAAAFEEQGFTAPVSFAVVASGPAHRDR